MCLKNKDKITFKFTHNFFSSILREKKKFSFFKFFLESHLVFKFLLYIYNSLIDIFCHIVFPQEYVCIAYCVESSSR